MSWFCVSRYPGSTVVCELVEEHDGKHEAGELRWSEGDKLGTLSPIWCQVCHLRAP